MEWITVQNYSQIFKLIEFDKLCFPIDQQLTFEEYKNWLFNGLEINLLIDNDTIVCSYQTIIIDNDLYFHGFAVHPNHRKNGYGQIMLDIIKDQYINYNIKCKTYRNNDIMIKLLIKNNFEEFDTEDDWLWWRLK